MRLGNINGESLRPILPGDLYRGFTPRMMRSSVILPSQHQAYAVCVEFARDWFLDKFPEQYFNSIYVDGTHSFDEFRKFSTIDQQMKRSNPLMAMVPVIDMNHNRQWIDSTPEIPMLMRRSKIEGTFFNDIRDNRGLHLQLIFKSILMNFTFKVRVDTRAEQLDMMEFIKLKHRAGYTETHNIACDIHVPNDIIVQIAFDNGFKLDEKGRVEDPIKMLNYLNTHSLIPFIYKLRTATGNDEYFIKVPNCVAHIKSELPVMDDGDRQDTITTNYNINFNIEVEMTAPYCYTYYSQHEHKFINSKPSIVDGSVAIMVASKTVLPPEDINHWAMLTYTEYEADEDELNKPLTIPLKEYFKGTELGYVLDYTQRIGISPAIFLNFGIYNDGVDMKYTMDWGKMECTTNEPITNLRTIIPIYCDMKYVNNTIINLEELDKKTSRI